MSLTACRVADLAAHGRLRARRFGGPKSKSRDRLKISKSSQRIEYTAWRCRERDRENFWEFSLGWDLLCQGCRSLCACIASATPCAGLAGAGLGLNVGDLL